MQENSEEGDFYVYQHRRNDTGEIFYVGKGCGPRARLKQGRTAAWEDVVLEAGGFTVDLIASGLSEEAALRLEDQTISSLSRKLVNVRVAGEQRPLGKARTNRVRKVVNVSMDRELGISGISC